MTNYESLQLVKDYSEGKARAQVEFYLVSTTNPTFEGLIQDLAKSFQSGEDEAMMKEDFYSRTQLAKESVDDFADVLQLLARKILNVDPSFQSLLNKSLCQQLANGLKDPSHGISARQILKQQPEISFRSLPFGPCQHLRLSCSRGRSKRRALQCCFIRVAGSSCTSEAPPNE